MYLHLGGDVIIKNSEVIGIFDLEQTTIEKNTRLFLENSQKKSMIINVSSELPKSFCVTSGKKNKNQVYICQMSPSTLKKRWENFLGFEGVKDI